MVRIETVKTESHIVSTIRRENLMYCYKYATSPKIQILIFCLGQWVEVNVMGNIVFQSFKKSNVFFNELIFN